MRCHAREVGVKAGYGLLPAGPPLGGQPNTPAAAILGVGAQLHQAFGLQNGQGVGHAGLGRLEGLSDRQGRAAIAKADEVIEHRELGLVQAIG